MTLWKLTLILPICPTDGVKDALPPKVRKDDRILE